MGVPFFDRLSFFDKFPSFDKLRMTKGVAFGG
jgi:hypothetical protein